MRIAYISAGAARMYCGSCLHDNALVGAMQRLGHDALLVPTYTRLRTDEPDVSVDRMFFGALNVYLKQVAPPLRRGSAWLERLLDRPGLIGLLARLGSATDPARLGDLTLSMLRGEQGFQAGELDKLVSWLRDEIQPDIVHLTNSMFAGFARRLKAELGVPVLCSVQGEELFLDGLAEPGRTAVRAALAERARDVDLFIAPGEAYAGFMASYLEVDRRRLAVVPLGIRIAGHGTGPHPARAGGPGAPLVVGFLGRIAPEKGLHLLVEAFREVARTLGANRVRLHIAGFMPPRQRRYWRDLERRLTGWRLGAAYRYFGEVTRDEKLGFLAGLDLLAAPTAFDEPKGLYALEALASGVPVVAHRRGIFPELLAATGGGVLVPPEQPGALAAALIELLSDPERRERLGRTGRGAVHARFSDDAMAAATVAIYERCLQPRQGAQVAAAGTPTT
jgi:glycosyltransferase involved in cell wall biosynthesis